MKSTPKDRARLEAELAGLVAKERQHYAEQGRLERESDRLSEAAAAEAKACAEMDLAIGRVIEELGVGPDEDFDEVALVVGRQVLMVKSLPEKERAKRGRYAIVTYPLATNIPGRSAAGEGTPRG